jgi:MoaA/NifB/PqqE/SkfB family radical SAM enzyme
MVNFNKFKNRLCLLKDFFYKRLFLTGMPLELLIEVTNKCNLRCIMCSRTKNPPTSEDYINFSLFQRILDQAKDHIELVLFHGLGEPLLNPNIFKMIQLCHKLKIQTELSTNATVLSKKVSLRLLNSD